MSRFRILAAQRLRRDWRQLLLWIAGTALMAYASFIGVAQSYATLADRRNILAAALANPVILMFRGLPSGTSQGAFIAFEVLTWLAMLAAFMSIFLAVRHTRGDEEAGRADLISATPAGRALPTIVTIVHGALANVVLAVLVALALIASGLDPRGSAISGAAAGATGIVFLGIGIAAAQLMRTSRAANSLAVWVLVAAFLVRGIGNVTGTPSSDLASLTSGPLAWFSPFGWAEQSRPYDADTVWPLLLAVAVGLTLAAAATALQSVRDTGASFVAGRGGRATARSTLSSPRALVWRLSAGPIIGWVIGGALTGLLATTLSSVVDQVVGENPAVAKIIESIARGGSIDEAVITVFFTMLGIIAACGAVQTVVRARQEEANGTAEPVLAAPVGRVRWLGDYLMVAAVAVLAVIAAAMGVGYLGVALSGGAPGLYRVVTVAGLGQLAAAAVFVALTAVIVVLAPRLTIVLSWALLLGATLLGLFGPLLGLPAWAANISPFAVTPIVSGDQVAMRGLLWLILVAVAGAAAALALMRRRELAVGG